MAESPKITQRPGRLNPDRVANLEGAVGRPPSIQQPETQVEHHDHFTSEIMRPPLMAPTPPLARPSLPEVRLTEPKPQDQDREIVTTNPTYRLVTEKVVPAAAAAGGLGLAMYEAAMGHYVPALILALSGGGGAIVINRVATWMNGPKVLQSELAESTSERASGPAESRAVREDVDARFVGPSLEEAVRSPTPGLKFATPGELARAYRRALEESREISVGDILQYRGEIPEKKRDEIVAKTKQTIEKLDLSTRESKQGAARARLKQAALALGNMEQMKDPAASMRKIADDILITREAVCTHFAALAAHILSRGGDEKTIPIEIMSRRESSGTAQRSTHLFTVVGRDPGSDINDPQTWGDGAKVVDLWLGAIGNPLIYNPSTYKAKGWLKNPEVVYSNMSRR